MSTDLDTRLRSLAELSPPSHGPLGASELHQRASARQRRGAAVRAVPAAVVVLALLAGAFALAGRSTSTDVVVGPPDGGVPDTALSEADRQMVGFLAAAAELRHQIDREMVLSAAYAATLGSNGRAELDAQRGATDVALQTYADRKPPLGGDPGVDEALAQADNRLERLDTNRRSVDTVQTDALGQIDPMAQTSAALQAIPLGYLQSVQDPDVFRGVLTASNLGNVATNEATTAATLTIPVEIGSYAAFLPKGTNPTVEPGGCGDDPSGAGNACPVFFDALAWNVDGDQLEQTFLTFATGEQKQLYRAAHAGSDYDQMVADIFDDGAGQNDLTGIAPGSTPIDPVAWRAAALQRIDRLAGVEQELYTRVLGGTPSRPADPERSGASHGTPPSAIVLSPGPDDGGSPTGTAPGAPTTTVEVTGTSPREIESREAPVTTGIR